VDQHPPGRGACARVVQVDSLRGARRHAARAVIAFWPPLSRNSAGDAITLVTQWLGWLPRPGLAQRPGDGAYRPPQPFGQGRRWGLRGLSHARGLVAQVLVTPVNLASRPAIRTACRTLEAAADGGWCIVTKTGTPWPPMSCASAKRHTLALVSLANRRRMSCAAHTMWTAVIRQSPHDAQAGQSRRCRSAELHGPQPVAWRRRPVGAGGNDHQADGARSTHLQRNSGSHCRWP